MFIGLAVAAVAAFLDQVSKMLVFGYLSEINSVVRVTSFFNLVPAWNTGVSFSMFNDLGGAGVYILRRFRLWWRVFSFIGSHAKKTA